jgi:predicted nicotinamide N-methyase
MSVGHRRSKRKQERQAFGLTVLDNSHPEIRRLQRQADLPVLHGEKVWRSSFLLMDYLEQRSIEPHVRVLELGCGWGLLGIYCARTFKACVTALDADAAVFPYLHLHAQLNGVDVQTRHLSFEHLKLYDLATFDLIVGADICFWDELVDPLCATIKHGIQAGVSEILVADPDRPPFDDLCARVETMCGADVLYWETDTPFSTSGRILRVVGNAH